MNDAVARIVVGHMGDPEEAKVGELLLDIGLELVGIHVPVSPDGDRYNNIGEVDLLFKHGDTAFIVEVSVQSKRGEKLKKFFTRFSETTTLDILKKRQTKISNVHYFKRIYFDIEHNYNEKELSEAMTGISNDGNHIVLKDEFGKLQEWVESEKKRRVDSFLDIVSRKGNGPISFPQDA